MCLHYRLTYPFLVFRPQPNPSSSFFSVTSVFVVNLLPLYEVFGILLKVPFLPVLTAYDNSTVSFKSKFHNLNQPYF